MPIGSVFGAFFSLYIPHHNHIQNIGTLSKIMRMNNMQKAAKNGLLLQSINVPGYQ